LQSTARLRAIERAMTFEPWYPRIRARVAERPAGGVAVTP
jgi:hypothetical protein